MVDGFLRRRPPRRPTVAAAPSTTTLSLNPTAQAEERSSRGAAAAFGVPQVQAAGHLDAAHPMLVLTRLQSAIGSLRVVIDGDPSGCDVLWELDDLRRGSLDRAPLDSGRRPLVSPDKEPGFVLGLRHAQALRRVIFWFPAADSVSIVLVDDTVIRCEAGMRVLAVYQLQGQLYLRYDGEDYATIDAVRTAYGF